MRGNGPRFAASVKGGPYLPVLHEDTAFDTIYGHQEENTVYNLGVDLILFDAFGEAGVGTSLGFMQFVGKGRIIQEGVSIASQDTTVFNILPLTAEVFYRLTYFNDEFGIPLSPYLRGGLAYYLWWNTNDAGETDLFYPKGETTEPVKAEGGKYGYTASVGVALELNAFEPSSAQRLEHTTGISSSSLFIEYETTSVNNFGGDGFDLSNTNVEAADGTTDSFNEWRVGLYLEF
jgi:hypothetical protein